MSLKVLIPGALTTVQDLAGWDTSSPAFPAEALWTGMLMPRPTPWQGTQPERPFWNTPYTAAAISLSQMRQAVLTGADMKPALDGRPVPMYRPFSVKAGQVLSLGMAENGCRTCLALAGGIDVPVVLGSRSTSIKCSLGGLEGRALKAGDRIPVGASSVPEAELLNRSLPPAVYESQVTVRVIPGPQEEAFTEMGLETFYSSSYTITPDSDRMGYRMDGPEIESLRGTDIISDAIVFGSIQVPSSGKPIILLADRQTTGGYAKIATVFSLDLPGLVQCRPGDTVRFSRISVEEAQELSAQKGDIYEYIRHEALNKSGL